MKYGIREICEVVLRAKAAQKVGNKIFYKNEPVIYFDSLKATSLEGTATTSYADGGRGNAHLVAWDGERRITWNMEDALISPESFMILSGAGLVEGSTAKPVYQHVFETTDEIIRTAAEEGTITIMVKNAPYLPASGDNYAYVMVKSGDDLTTEPIIPVHTTPDADGNLAPVEVDEATGLYPLVIQKDGALIGTSSAYVVDDDNWDALVKADVVLVDYYTPRYEGTKQIDITPDKFGGNYYLEASTLFRNKDGVDMPAEFIIPNCKIQSNFTFSMSASGDPSTFSFVMDAFPDYTRFDKTKKVLAALQVVENVAGEEELLRVKTASEDSKYFD